MAYDGALKFDTKVDQAGFVSGIANIKSIALSAISVIGSAFAAGAIVQGMAQVGREGIELASSLSEVQNVIDVTFEDGAQSVNDFAKSAKNAFGLSELAAKKYTGTLGAMLKSMGLTLDAVGEMSTAMTGLAGDFASFYNISTDEAFQKIRAGIAGETEPLRQLGINMSVANLEAYALAQGIDTAYASMTQAEQATLRFNYLMSVSADAQGDFARTSDSYANSQRLAALATDELKTAIGNRLIPVAKQFQQELGKIAGAAADAIGQRGLAGFIDVITDRFPLATSAAAGLAASMAALLIINVLTPGVKALAAAQKILNAVMSASPVFILVTAVGALVGAITLLNKRYEELHPEAAQALDDVGELTNKVKTSSNAFRESAEEIESSRRGTLAMIDALSQMSAEYGGTSIEQRKMQSIVDQLNGAISGLNLSFDAQTGKLSTNTEALRTMTEAQYEAAKGAAELARYTRLLEEQADAEYALRQARKAFYAAGDGSGATVVERLKLNKAVREAQDAYNSVSAEILDLNDNLESNTALTDESTQSLNALTEAERELADEVDRIVIGGYDVTDVLDDIGMTADDVAARLDNFTAAATNMFDKISTESKLKVSEMIGNLEFNATALQDWSDNIVYLGQKLPSDLLQPLIDSGPEDMAGVLNELAGASDEELGALVAAFENGGENAKDAWLQSLGAGLDGEENPLLGVLEGADDAASEAGEAFGQSLVTSIKSQNYSGATSSLTDAFKKSFESIKGSFSALLERVHFDLAYAIGGVRIDLAYLAYEVAKAMEQIPTEITIRVNVVYSSSGSVGGLTGTTGQTGAIGGGLAGGVYAPITIGGVVESDTQLANRITRNFEEVVYGRNS